MSEEIANYKCKNPTFAVNIRIDDVDFAAKDPSEGEFSLWYSNPHYGKMEQYLKEGFIDNENCITKDRYSISKQCFVYPENKYVIAFLKYEEGSNCCEITSVGSRLLDLTTKQREDFFEVYKLAESKLIQLNEQDEY